MDTELEKQIFTSYNSLAQIQTETSKKYYIFDQAFTGRIMNKKRKFNCFLQSNDVSVMQCLFSLLWRLKENELGS